MQFLFLPQEVGKTVFLRYRILFPNKILQILVLLHFANTRTTP